MTSVKTQETIQKVVEEGLEARNLLNFISDGLVDDIKSAKKPPVSPRPQSVSPNPLMLDSSKASDARTLFHTNKRRGTLSRPKSRLRSASAGRNPEKDLRARYWTFLFENLHRAVDEIYQTCEMDESIVESKEAIMMLENYSKDFHALIQYINISKNYEKTAPPDRPTSLAWEVRKSSPGKSFLKNVFIEKLTTGTSNAKRILCFDSPIEFPKNTNVKSTSDKAVAIVRKLSIAEVGVQNCEFEDKGRKPEKSMFEITAVSKETYDVNVPVVSEHTDDSFPCNENLVINEVDFQDEVTLPSYAANNKDSGDLSLSTPQTLSDSLVNDCLVSISETAGTSPHMEISDETESKSDLCNEITADTNQKVDVKTDADEQGDGRPSNAVSFSEAIVEEKLSVAKINTSPFKPSLVKDSSARSKSSLPSNKNFKTSGMTAILKKSVSSAELKKPLPSPADSRGSSKSSLASSESKTPKISSNPAEGKPLPKNPVQESSSEKPCRPKSPKDLNANTKSKTEQPTKNSSMSGTVTSRPERTSSSVSAHKPVKTAATSSAAVTRAATSAPRPERLSSSEEKRLPRVSKNESAIKRNISYVQSLSSRNQSNKKENAVVKGDTRVRPSSGRLSKKSGSMSSLNKTQHSQNWDRKTASVEKIPEISKSNTDDDSDGWETVRSRNRCRNSPAKKLPFTNKNHEDQVVQLAKLNQSRIGGFPYTTKVNGKIINKNSPKTDALKKTREVRKDESAIVDANAPRSPKLPAPSESEVCTKQTSNAEEKASRICSMQLPLDVVYALENKKHALKSFAKTPLIRSSSAPSDVHGTAEGSMYSLSRTLCISDQSLSSQKYVNVNLFRKQISEKSLNFSKRRNKRIRSSDDSSGTKGLKNGSMDESDNGLTSDDQDGPMSHDEAYEVNCQELCDTAWKYKILEQQVHKLELSWGEQMDRFDMELRTPGRALEMHEKLSSPFRKKSLFESIRVCNEKQVKAQEQRERLLVEKAQKFKIIQRKRQEMKSLVDQRQEKQRIIMEQKLQRAEEKRKKQLQMIIRKAHDEEEKVNEIAFINTLEAQNKRHDLISKEKDHEARLHDIQEERQRKLDEKAAKEAAAEGRRKVLEAERLARLNEMQEKRKMRDHKVEQLFLVKEKERQELASQKARDRELRLSALNAQQQISIEELQKKIQLKQEESARRHEENMEQIRQKAFELSIRRCSSNNDDVPQPVPYETKKICTICNVLIGSEVYLLSHLHGKKHQEAVKLQYQGHDPSTEELELYNLKHIVDASTDQLDPNIALDKERQKALKKRCKKLRQRMCNRGQEFESQEMKHGESLNPNVKTKVEKLANDVKKHLSAIKEGCKDPGIFSSVERSLNDLAGVYQKKLHGDKSQFKAVGGVSALINVFGVLTYFPVENNALTFRKTLNHLSILCESVVDNSQDICKFILFSNKIGNMLDYLIHRLNNLIPDNIHQLMINQTKTNGVNIQLDATAGKLIHLLTIILSGLFVEHRKLCLDKKIENRTELEDFHLRVQDLISYIVSIGIVDKLSQFFNCIQGPMNNEDEVALFLQNCILFLTALVRLNSECSASNRKTEDSTQLIATFRITNMVGCISLLYGLLLHSGAPSRSQENPPPPLPKQIELLALSALCMLNHVALVNLSAFQTTLGSEGLSLQLRHITSHLLWYCNHHLSAENLLHEIILLIGYFTALNTENQSIIQAGQSPSVLQQLCCLPFLYFSDSELTDILFPTLIACCYKSPANKTILEQEMSSELLSNYIEVKYLTTEDSTLKDSLSVRQKRWMFPVRFPKCHWSSAKHYFSET